MQAERGQMKNAEPIRTRGYFWLPESREERLPGELRISEHGRIDLDLIGLFPNANWSGSGDVQQMWGHLREVRRICGHVEDGGDVTLLNCMLTSAKTNIFSANGLEFSSFKATMALLGADLRQDELTFRELRFVAEGLDDWLDMDTIKTSIYVEEVDGKMKSLIGGSVEYGHQESPSYPLEKGIEIQFFSSVTSSSLFPNLPLSHFSLTSQPYISLTSVEPRDIEHFLELADKVRKFISLAVDQEVQFQSFTLLDEDSGRASPIRLYLQMRRANKDKYKPRILKVLFTLPDVEERFAEIMNSWINQYEPDKAGHALNLYFAGAWKESSLLDSNLMFLAQSVEVLHRSLHPDHRPLDRTEYRKLKKKIFELLPDEIPPLIKAKIDEANRPSLRDRVQKMMEPFEDWFRDNENSEEFAIRVSNTRNYFTHYSSEIKNGLGEVEGLFSLYTKLEILLLLHVLKLIGFDMCQIAEVVERSQRLEKALDTSD